MNMLMCSYWENRCVPSMKVRCSECRKWVAVSYRSDKRLGGEYTPVCIPCAVKNHGDEATDYMYGLAPPGMEADAMMLAGLPVSVAARFLR